MARISRPFLFSILASVGCVLLALTWSGSCSLVVIGAETINKAPLTGTANLPLLEDLIRCPFLDSGGHGGIFSDTYARFLIVNCTSDTGLIALASCNSALARVNTIEVYHQGFVVPGEDGTDTVLIPDGTFMATAMPLLTHVASSSSPYTAGALATYSGGIDFTKATGITLQVTLAAGSNAQANGGLIASLIRGVRGLVNLDDDNTKFPIVILPIESGASGTLFNPCNPGHVLYGVSLPSLYTPSPGTRPYLLIWYPSFSDNEDLCGVPHPNAYYSLTVTDTWGGGKFSSCSDTSFSSPNPRDYYQANFHQVTDDWDYLPSTFLQGAVSRYTNLSFYPFLSASGSIAPGVRLASVLACINSKDSSSALFGRVGAIVVHCDDLYASTTFDSHFKTCQIALFAVREQLGTTGNLFVSVGLSTVGAAGDLPLNVQGQYAVATTYGTLVSGAVIRLRFNEGASLRSEVEANFAGVAAFASAFSSIFLQADPDESRFSLILRFNETACGWNGPLAPQGTGAAQTSVYRSCTVAGVNCLFATTGPVPTDTAKTECGFPAGSILGWESFRGVATAPTDGGIPLAADCDDGNAITPAYQDVTILSGAPLEGPVFRYGSVGAWLTLYTANNDPTTTACAFSGDGAGASYGIVVCDPNSAAFPNNCLGGFDNLRNASETVAIIAGVPLDPTSGALANTARTFGGLLDQAAWAGASGGLDNTGRALGDLLNKAGWSGIYLNLTFETWTDSHNNIVAVVDFVKTLVAATNLPSGSDLTIGLIIQNASVCTAGGALYTPTATEALFPLLTQAVSGGVSFVLLAGDTPSVSALPGLCGFGPSRVGYLIRASRAFNGSCENVSLSYDLVTFSPSVTPTKPADEGGDDGGGDDPGDGGESGPSPYWAFFAIPGAAILVCFGSAGTAAVINRRRHRQSSHVIPTSNPSSPYELE